MSTLLSNNNGTFDLLKFKDYMSLLPALGTVEVKLVSVTPEFAKELLGSNVNNRDVRPHHVQYLAKLIANKEFKVNGDTIVISKRGRLLNGQHRLHGIIESNKSAEMLIVWNVDDDAFHTFDSHLARRDSDHLKLYAKSNGREHTNTIARAAAIQTIMNIEYGRVGIGISTSGDRRAKISVAEKLKFDNEHNEVLTEIVKTTLSVYNKFRMISPKTLSGLMWQFLKKDQKFTYDFLEKYATGVNLRAEDPIFKLRQVLIKDAGSKDKKYSDKMKYNLMVRAWNAIKCDTKFSPRNTAGEYEVIR